MIAPRFVYAASAALALAALVPARAQADAGRAWAAAKDNLPANTSMVIGADVGAITKSTLFGQLLPLALSQQADVKKGLELVKASCKIDPLAAIQGLVVARDPDANQGAIYLSLGAGLDQPKLTKCLEEIAKASGVKDAKLSVKKTGAVTELTMDKDKAYVSWIGSDVLVIPLDIRDKAQLEKWIGQKGGFARSPVSKLLAGASSKGAVWGASSQAKQLDPGINMKGAHGALTMAGGNLGIELHVTLDSAKAAADAVAKANAQIAQVAAGNLPPNVQAMLKQISVKAAGAEVTIKATVPESEVLGLMSMIGP
ncbi:MAG TPA: hypothetical protein VN253_13800 [Kofleriaceae bacterium]|nr:hypothetical protein [Kofleriaceae bacterium]